MKYLKKYYKLIIAAVVVCVLVISLLGGLFGGSTINTGGYSVDNVNNTIKELSSEKYQGRRYGTKSNEDAVKYIEDQFKSTGLEPAGDDNTYLRKYGEGARSYNGIAVLELIDSSGKVVKQYKYGDDFIEQGYGYSCPGELTSGYSFLEYSGQSMVKKPEEGSLIAIVNVSKHNQTIMDNLAITLMRENYTALITTVPDNTNLRQDTAGIGGKLPHKSGYEMPSLIIKDKVGKELLSYKDKGYKIHLKSTFDYASAQVADVMGMIPGTSSDYVLITSHLDNVGPQSDGTIYPGALDDASGVGAMLEIARFIKSQNKTPSKNLLFIAFNGNEGGLLGSDEYIFKNMYSSNIKYPLYMSSVINIDMIGARGSAPLNLLYDVVNNPDLGKDNDPSSKMRYHMEKLCQSLGIPVQEMKDSSMDHELFTQVGVPAITISDNDKALSRTPDDTPDKIDKANIDRALKLVTSYISLTAYSNFSTGGYSIFLEEVSNLVGFLYPYLIGLAAAVILLIVLSLRRKKVNNSRSGNVPVFSIISIIILMGIISYFPLKYPYAPSQDPGMMGLILEGVLSIAISVAIVLPLYFASALFGMLIVLIGKRRMLNPKYVGDGSELKYYYYVALVLIVVSSIYLAIMYDMPQYLAVTPDFARYISGKIMLYICLGVISYIVSRLMDMETGSKLKPYKSLAVFSIIFFVLLSSFYMPIATNKYAMSQNYLKANVGASYSIDVSNM